MSNSISQSFEKIVQLIKDLRAPGGCAWDREQNFYSIAPMILEEVHEVIEALDHGDNEALVEELGDVLWDVIFIANIAEDEQLFTLQQVLDNLAEKIVRRHPHVWGPQKTTDSAKIKALYHAVKKKDYQGKRKGPFDGIAKTLPALSKALKTVKKAQKTEINLPQNKKLAQETKNWGKEQWGEFLFQASAIAREQKIDLEQALRTFTQKFINKHSK